MDKWTWTWICSSWEIKEFQMCPMRSSLQSKNPPQNSYSKCSRESETFCLPFVWKRICRQIQITKPCWYKTQWTCNLWYLPGKFFIQNFTLQVLKSKKCVLISLFQIMPLFDLHSRFHTRNDLPMQDNLLTFQMIFFGPKEHFKIEVIPWLEKSWISKSETT